MKRSSFGMAWPTAAAGVLCAAIVSQGAWAGGCDGDATGDNTVNVSDLTTVILDWGCVDPPGPCPGDVTGDGVTDVSDLTTVILNWGDCPPGGYECNSTPASPANDCCSSPQVITGLNSIGQSVVVSYDTTDAETDGPDDTENPCDSASDDSQIHKDVWFRYDATIDGLLEVSNCGLGDVWDSKIAVYSIPGGTVDCNDVAPNLVICNEDCDAGNDARSTAVVATLAGESFLVRLGGFSITAQPEDAEFGAGTLSWTLRPTNDLCDSAAAIAPPGGAAGIPSSITQNLCPATLDPELPDCDLGVPNAQSLWFTTVGDGTTYTASLCGTSDFNWDTRISIYCATEGASACEDLFCDDFIFFTAMDDTCGFSFLNEEREFCTEAGREYLILVHSAFGCGDFTLTMSSNGVQCFEPTCDPATGRCCFVEAACSAGLTNFDCTSQGGVWAEGADCSAACPTGGCCLGENPCQEGITEADCLVLAGVFVDAGLCANLPCPINDTCEGALDLGTGDVSMPWNNTLATNGGEEGAPFTTCDKFGDSPGIRKDLWFTWTAGADAMVRFDTCNGGLDTKMAVYLDEGCPPGPLADIGCNDDDGNNEPLPLCTEGGGTASAVQLSVSNGTTYLIRVGSWGGRGGNDGPDGDSLINVTEIPEP